MRGTYRSLPGTVAFTSLLAVLICGMCGVNNASAVPITTLGKGLTDAYNTDNDGDGYISTGNRDGNVIAPLFAHDPNPEIKTPDANDNDPTLNSPATVAARYGSFTNIQNFKNYLQDLGYTHEIGNVFFISPTGNSSTAQPNNINLPYLNVVTTPYYGPAVVQPGDVIVYLEGTYLVTNTSGWLNTRSHSGWAPGIGTYAVGYQGTAARPILIINEPGKRVIFRAANGLTDNIFGITPSTEHVIIDGFEFDGEYAPNQIVYRVAQLGDGFSHITIKNSEFRNGDRWGIFWTGGFNRHYVTLDNITVHDTGYEHCMYKNGNMYPSFGHPLNATDTYITVENSRFNYCGNGGGHGIHWRDGTHSIIRGNMIWGTAWEGMEVKNGTQDMLIENNLIFNVGRNALTFWNEGGMSMQRPLKDIRIINNILLGLSGTNGQNGGGGEYSAINIQHGETPPNMLSHEDFQIKNNIMRTQSNYPIRFGYGPAFVNDLQEFEIENNVFFRDSHVPGHDQAGMLVCNDTGLGATSGPHTFSWCPNAYLYDLAAMQNPTYRPQFRNNVLGDPQFADFSLGYRLTTWLYNFDPTENSPSIDLGLSAVAPLADFRGNSRVGAPDAGVYEYGVGGDTPVITSMSPGNIQNGVTETSIYVEGENFHPLAKIKLELPGVGSMYLPNGKVHVINSSALDFMFPERFFSGTYKIAVENPNTLISEKEDLVVNQNPAYVPVLTSMTPNTLVAGNEAFVTLSGENLGSYQEYYRILVTWMGQEYVLDRVFIHSVSPSSIVLHVPNIAPVGIYSIKVQTWAGITVQTFDLVIQDPPPAPPSLTGGGSQQSSDGSVKQKKSRVKSTTVKRSRK